MFEHVSRIAAQNYLGGRATRFGFPRVAAEIPTKFGQAVTVFCRLLGEVRYNGNKPGRAKDDELDVVAWKHFRDQRAGKIILWGQCAAGWDWETKLAFDPETFRKRWTLGDFASPLLKSIFIPHVVEASRWDFFCAAARILFDRCRIASCTFGENDLNDHADNMKIWCEWILKENSK